MVVTTVCGAVIGFNLYVDEPGQYRGLFEGFAGGVIGAVVGVPIWVWLRYMICRDKKTSRTPARATIRLTRYNTTPTFCTEAAMGE